MIWEKENFRISSEKSQEDVEALHGMIRKYYWAKHRSREAVEKSVETSLYFRLFGASEQISFARVLTATMAYANTLTPFSSLVTRKINEFLSLKLPPDGHLKIPHLWPGQNPPATELKI